MPLYLDIALSLEQEISKYYQFGEQLPAEQDLAKRYGVNRHTLRRAVDELVRQGWLLRQQGKRLQVLRKPVRYALHSGARFTDSFRLAGASPKTEVLSYSTQRADERCALNLGVAKDSNILLIQTLRYVDEVPVSLISHHIIDGPHRHTLSQFREGSLHHLLNQQCQIKLKRSRTLVNLASANNDESRKLNTVKSAPLLCLYTLNRDIQGRPFEYSISKNRAELVELCMEHDT
ncbi:phosphonate metabolism transcriptional regulator PhnF [Alginatibacterium sediminis]|uniref:Phosphonate metabolism transcriptional regulator PhnF n=1 Tax=Alginatibacterium sediminis TaxID=2164068 RepID=A0A420ELB6_9ALTE|nr:phosphonate metabolism transcriptional regulator PhnF [Alginatibacterium sediminis]RKF21430.1 phosphonate metabolism transcriptional regulator PhnF [Alginatibacterium sediminis]